VSYQIDIALARHSASRAVGCLWPRIITKRGPLIEPPVAIGFPAREDRRRRVWRSVWPSSDRKGQVKINGMFNVWGGGSQRAKNLRADPWAAQQRQNL